MRRTPSATLVAAVMVGGLALSLAPAAAPALGSAADDGTSAVAPQARAAGSTDRERATAALERAKGLFSGKASPSRKAAAGQTAVTVPRARASTRPS